MTTGEGQCRFNPNLYKDGKVCLSILGTWLGPSWTAVQTIGSLCLSIMTLLNENPYRNEPGHEHEKGAQVEIYNDIIRHETLRFAVVGMADPKSNLNVSLPDEIRQCINELFLSFYDIYKLNIESYRHLQGKHMLDPFSTSRGIYDFAAIDEQIDTIRDALTSDSKASTDITKNRLNLDGGDRNMHFVQSIEYKGSVYSPSHHRQPICLIDGMNVFFNACNNFIIEYNPPRLLSMKSECWS